MKAVPKPMNGLTNLQGQRLQTWGDGEKFICEQIQPACAYMILSFGKEEVIAEIVSVRQFRTFSVIPSLSIIII